MTAFNWSQKSNQAKKKPGTIRMTGASRYGRLTSEENLSDILTRLSKGQSLASIAKLYGCSYQAIQQIRNSHART